MPVFNKNVKNGHFFALDYLYFLWYYYEKVNCKCCVRFYE